MTREEKLAKLKELKALKAQQEAQGEVEDVPAEEQSGLDTAMDLGKGGLAAGGKVLDVQRGATTGPALAKFLETVSGEDVYRPEEHLQAVNPTNVKSYPSSAELFERAGIPEMGRTSNIPGADYIFGEPGSGSFLEKGGAMDFTTRGALGTVTDVLIDPATWESLGILPASKALGKALSKLGIKTPQMLDDFIKGVTQPAKELQEKAGKFTYRQGLRNIDSELEVLNRKPLADELMTRGVWGTSKTIKEGIDNIRSDAYKMMDEAVDTLEYGGQSKIPIGDAAFSTQKIADQATSSATSSVRNQGKKLERLINDHLDKGLEVSPRQAQKMYKDLGKNIDWSNPGKSLENIGTLNLQQRIGKSLDDAFKSTDPQLAKQWEQGNQLYSSAKTVDKTAAKQIKSEMKKPWVSQVTGLASVLNPYAAGAKEGVRFIFSPTGATSTGMFLKKTAPLTEIGLKRTTPIWQELYNSSNEGEEK